MSTFTTIDGLIIYIDTNLTAMANNGQRKASDRHIEKAFHRYNSVSKELLKKAYLETKLETLETFWNEFMTNHNKIVGLKGYKESSYFSEDVFDIAEETYSMYKSELKSVLSEFSTTKHCDPTNVSHDCSKNSKVHLPKITQVHCQFL